MKCTSTTRSTTRSTRQVHGKAKLRNVGRVSCKKMTKNKLMKNALLSVKSSLPAFSLQSDLRQESDPRPLDLRQ